MFIFRVENYIVGWFVKFEVIWVERKVIELKDIFYVVVVLLLDVYIKLLYLFFLDK